MLGRIEDSAELPPLKLRSSRPSGARIMPIRWPTTPKAVERSEQGSLPRPRTGRPALSSKPRWTMSVFEGNVLQNSVESDGEP
jgi:hypothetical protein